MVSKRVMERDGIKKIYIYIYSLFDGVCKIIYKCVYIYVSAEINICDCQLHMKKCDDDNMYGM